MYAGACNFHSNGKIFPNAALPYIVFSKVWTGFAEIWPELPGLIRQAALRGKRGPPSTNRTTNIRGNYEWIIINKNTDSLLSNQSRMYVNGHTVWRKRITCGENGHIILSTV
jgi:hypothetical protein